MARPKVLEADLDLVIPTARQDSLVELSLADTVEVTAMARPKAPAVA
jgi:hypothetical protein